MGNFLTILEVLRGKVCGEAVICILFSFLTLMFSEQLSGGLPLGVEMTLKSIAGFLFIAGLLVAFLTPSHFSSLSYPARGIIDGLVAGFVAGAFGGLLGYGGLLNYGSHSTFVYTTTPLFRTLLCIPFSIVVGGVLGFCVDIFHPYRQIAWRKNAGVITLCIIALFVSVGICLFNLVPTANDVGIQLHDIEIIFEVCLFAMTAITTLRFDWSMRKYLARVPILLINIFMARVFTSVVFLSDTKESIKLSEWQYITGTAGGIDLSASVFILMAWFLLSYGSFYLSSPVSRWSEQRFKVVSSNARHLPYNRH